MGPAPILTEHAELLRTGAVLETTHQRACADLGSVRGDYIGLDLDADGNEVAKVGVVGVDAANLGAGEDDIYRLVGGEMVRSSLECVRRGGGWCSPGTGVWSPRWSPPDHHGRRRKLE
ncbi:Uncharacterized protein Fot_24875 [Forsythia ovata]|uniref:Uncharacterized protein n=1 Tax=Forsythia ovata TaxID=205694 RepID=A0ABD1U7M0_9LAMI